MIYTVIHPRLTSTLEGGEDDARVVVDPFSIIGQVPIEEIAHPVLIAIEGENRAIYDFDEVVRLLVTGSSHTEHADLPRELAHFSAMRARDTDEQTRPQAATLGVATPNHAYLRHLETGSGPLTRKRFTSADVAPVHIVGAPPTPDAPARRLETIHLLLHRAVLDGFVERAHSLMALRGDPAMQPSIPGGGSADSALAIAVRGNQLAMVKALLLPASDIVPQLDRMLRITRSASTVRKTPLVVVAAKADPSGALLRELLPHTSPDDVCDDGRCALALPDISLECVKALHRAGARVNATSPTHDSPLTVACMGGRLDIAKYMLAVMRADPNLGAERTGGATPLHFAAQGGYDDLVMLLVMAKANPAARDFEDRNAIHYAVRSNRSVSVLLKAIHSAESEAAKRALLDAPDALGQTPMHTAARLCHMASIEALLVMGATADARNERDHGRTPLHVAAAHDFPDVASRILFKCPRALDIADAQGRTPLQAALFGKSKAVFDLLLERGARVDLDMFGFALRNYMWVYARNMLAAHRMHLKEKDGTTSSALHEFVGSSYFNGHRILFSEDEKQLMEEILEMIFEQEPDLIHHAATGAHAPCACTALQYAYYLRHPRAAHMLIRHLLPRTLLADVPRMLAYCEHETTLLHDMAITNDVRGLSILLGTARGRAWVAEHINDKERSARATPLLLAIAGLRGPNSLDSVDRLERRARRKGVCLPDACTNIALDISESPKVKIVEMLLAAGADPSVADRYGFTAVHYWLTTASVVAETRPPHGQAVLDLLPNYLYRASEGARVPASALLAFLRAPDVEEAWRLNAKTNRIVDAAIAHRHDNHDDHAPKRQRISAH